jgi:hypothetical protein
VVDGEVVDATPMLDEVTAVGEVVAIRHAGAALAATDVGRCAVVRIFDGDSGVLVMVLEVPR